MGAYHLQTLLIMMGMSRTEDIQRTSIPLWLRITMN
jgi:hypothetical protein